MFLTLLYFPICTVSLTEEIYKALSKIFDGRNPAFIYDFLSEELRIEGSKYLNEIGGLERWKSEGFDKMKTAINSVLIVDMSEEQMTDRPNPYYYYLPFCNVRDFKNQKDNTTFEWIIFEQKEKDQIAVFCDGFYRVFQKDETNVINPVPVVENSHDLGFCPARFFWSSSINESEPFIKKSPISNQLGKLDMLLFYEVSNEHLNTYGRFPIFSSFSTDCDFIDRSGNECDGGFLRSHVDGLYMHRVDEAGNFELSPCPKCEANKLVGAGSHIEVDPPNAANENADLRNPVQIIGVDRPTLDYNNEDIRRRREEIYKAITGFQGLNINDKAVNEKQVIAIFETLESALLEPQRNFEAAIKWTHETILKLRYGSSFVSLDVSLGTEHYIYTSNELLEMYKYAKESNFSFTVLDMLENKYFETEYRNNPNELAKKMILVNLDPFRHLSIPQVDQMYEKNQINFEDYFIKKNLSSLILKFEREVLPINQYGINSPFDDRVKSIYEELKKYALAFKATETPQSSN